MAKANPENTNSTMIKIFTEPASGNGATARLPGFKLKDLLAVGLNLSFNSSFSRHGGTEGKCPLKDLCLYETCLSMDFFLHSMTDKGTANVSQWWAPSTSDGYGADSTALRTGFFSLSSPPPGIWVHLFCASGTWCRQNVNRIWHAAICLTWLMPGCPQ